MRDSHCFLFPDTKVFGQDALLTCFDFKVAERVEDGFDDPPLALLAEAVALVARLDEDLLLLRNGRPDVVLAGLHRRRSGYPLHVHVDRHLQVAVAGLDQVSGHLFRAP